MQYTILITLFLFVSSIKSQTPSSSSDRDIKALLENFGCKTFASLVSSTGVLNSYRTASFEGLTIFSPLDEAFSPQILQSLSMFTNDQVISLLKYHALASYEPIPSLKAAKRPIATLATNGTKGYTLSFNVTEKEFFINTEFASSKIRKTNLDSPPLSIYTIDNVLLPTELFGKRPSLPASPLPPPPHRSSKPPQPTPHRPVNITTLLETAGCKMFASLITFNGVAQVFQTVANTGLTVFAPLDNAFDSQVLQDLNKVTKTDLVSLLRYHALGTYMPVNKLIDYPNPLRTLATNMVEEYVLNVTKNYHKNYLTTGVGFGQIKDIVVDKKPLSIVTVDNVLLPADLFGKTNNRLAPFDVNITNLLEKAGCKTFLNLITSTGVINVYQKAATKGLTIFAPLDMAFKSPYLPDLSKLTNAQVVSLLKYHAMGSYIPIEILRDYKEPIKTLATSDGEKYELVVTSNCSDIVMNAGLASSRTMKTLIDLSPLSIFTIDTLLLSIDLKGNALS